MDLIAFLLLVGTSVAVPIGLAILERRTLHPRERTLLRIGRRVQPIAAVSLIGSFIILPGPMAAALAGPWLLFGAFLGMVAMVRLVNGGWRFPIQLCYTAALAYVPIGAAWLFASRAGINPMGFGEPIVLLTGVHFHFSGFAASVIAGEVVRCSQKYAKAGKWVALGAVSATPLIATGFVVSWLLKAIAILYFSTTLAALAALQMIVAANTVNTSPKWLLRISSFSIIIGMVLASIYGVTEYLGWPALSIPQMAHFHGTLNAFGFTLCGLTGWLLQIKKEATC